MEERRGEVAGLEVRWLQAGEAAVLFLHGVPTSSDIWAPFIDRAGGLAVDLPGFGGSAKPASFDYSIAGYASFLEQLVRWERFSLVLHDWGAGLGLALAQRMPERIERLVLIDAVPLLPGYRWHRVARLWRRRVVGELTMGFTTKLAFRRALGAELAESCWRHFDHGTQRAILKLYRSAPEDVLARAGKRLGNLTCPALVLWGTEDPYLPVRFADAYAEALGGEARVERLEGAGHWPWLDRPELVGRVAGFLR